MSQPLSNLQDLHHKSEENVSTADTLSLSHLHLSCKDPYHHSYQRQGTLAAVGPRNFKIAIHGYKIVLLNIILSRIPTHNFIHFKSYWQYIFQNLVLSILFPKTDDVTGRVTY